MFYGVVKETQREETHRREELGFSPTEEGKLRFFLLHTHSIHNAG